MVNKDKTGADRQSRLRASRVKWLAENAYGLSAEGLIGALMRGECSLSWARAPTSRALDGAKRTVQKGPISGKRSGRSPRH